MNQTSNFGLSQWEKDDRIQMEDFNADNTKIDAALQALHAADRYAPLKTIVTTEVMTKVDVDLSDVDWSMYPQLILLVEGEAENGANAIILFNDDTSHYYYRDMLNEEKANTHAGILHLGMNDGYFQRVTLTGASANPQCDVFCGGLASSSSYYYTGTDGKGAALNKVSFTTGTSNLQPGFRITVYGVRF